MALEETGPPPDPPASRAVAPPASQAFDPAHRAFISTGGARLAARCMFQPDAFRTALSSRLAETSPPDPPAADYTDAHVVHSLTGHSPGDDGLPMFRVRWYGYDVSDSTWEPAHHIDYNTVVRYCRKSGYESGALTVAATRQRRNRKLG